MHVCIFYKDLIARQRIYPKPNYMDEARIYELIDLPEAKYFLICYFICYIMSSIISPPSHKSLREIRFDGFWLLSIFRIGYIYWYLTECNSCIYVFPLKYYSIFHLCLGLGDYILPNHWAINLTKFGRPWSTPNIHVGDFILPNYSER